MTDDEVTDHLAHIYTYKSNRLTKKEQEAVLFAMVYLRQKIKRKESSR